MHAATDRDARLRWDELTEAQRDEYNSYCADQARDMLRDKLKPGCGHDLDSARESVAYDLDQTTGDAGDKVRRIRRKLQTAKSPRNIAKLTEALNAALDTQSACGFIVHFMWDVEI